MTKIDLGTINVKLSTERMVHMLKVVASDITEKQEVAVSEFAITYTGWSQKGCIASFADRLSKCGYTGKIHIVKEVI